MPKTKKKAFPMGYQSPKVTTRTLTNREMRQSQARTKGAARAGVRGAAKKTKPARPIKKRK